MQAGPTQILVSPLGLKDGWSLAHDVRVIMGMRRRVTMMYFILRMGRVGMSFS